MVVGPRSRELAPAARGSQEAGFTQPRNYSLAHPCRAHWDEQKEYPHSNIGKQSDLFLTVHFTIWITSFHARLKEVIVAFAPFLLAEESIEQPAAHPYLMQIRSEAHIWPPSHCCLCWNFTETGQRLLLLCLLTVNVLNKFKQSSKISAKFAN